MNAPETTSTDLLEVISMRLDTLSAAERLVAETILADPAEAAAKSIGQMAIAAGSSEATVTRFCRSIGLRGYPNLRLQLAVSLERRRGKQADSGMALLGEIDRADSAQEVLRKVAFANTRAIEMTLAQLDVDALSTVVGRLATARRILTFGVAASATAAGDAAAKLALSNCAPMMMHDVHGALMTTSLFDEHDVVLTFSHSGRAEEVVDVLNASRLRGAFTVAVTSDATSPAAKAASIALITAAREPRFRSGGIAARSAQLAVVDAIFVLLAHRRFDEAIDAGDTMHDVVAGHVIADHKGM